MAPPFGMILRAIAAGPPGLRGGKCCSSAKRTADTVSEKVGSEGTVVLKTNKLDAKPTLQYFDVGNLAGRGGYIRFWFLANGVDYHDELVSFGEWMDIKADLVQSGDNPAGLLPIVRLGNKVLVEHLAILRFLSRQIGTYGVEPVIDYEVDAAADQYASWVSAWAATVVHAPEEAVVQYRDSREAWYKLFETLYSKRSHQDSGPFFASSPTFVDCCVFGLIRDDQLLHGAIDLPSYPHLRKLVDGMIAIPAVRAWITAADLTAAASATAQQQLQSS